MMTVEKQILEGTAAIKTLESIYADKKLSAEIKKINADACSGMAQAEKNRYGSKKKWRRMQLE